MTLNGKILVVTGVASGIGAELARLARFQGATVIGVDRNQPQFSLDDFHQADLGDPDSIAALVSRLPARLHGLCNIAGVPGTAPRETVARVNYLGLRLLSQHLAPNGRSAWNRTAIWRRSPTSPRPRPGWSVIRSTRPPATSTSRRRSSSGASCSPRPGCANSACV